MKSFSKRAAQWLGCLTVGYLILVWFGTVTSYRTMSHIIMVLTAIGVGSIQLYRLVKGRYWDFLGIGIALAAVVFVISLGVETRLRNLIYITDISITPYFLARCHPKPGIEVEGVIIQICRIYDFNRNGFVDVIVKMEGPNCCDQVIQRIYEGQIPSDAKNALRKEGTIWEKNFVATKLVDGFFLFHLKIDNFL